MGHLLDHYRHDHSRHRGSDSTCMVVNMKYGLIVLFSALGLGTAMAQDYGGPPMWGPPPGWREPPRHRPYGPGTGATYPTGPMVGPCIYDGYCGPRAPRIYVPRWSKER